MKGENEIAVDQARAAIKNSTQLTKHAQELVAQSAALLARSGTLCTHNPETNILKSLRIDLKVGLTFAAIAAKRPDERRRNQWNARIAHDTVLQQLKRLRLSNSDEAEIQSGLRKLRTTLEQLGESV